MYADSKRIPALVPRPGVETDSGPASETPRQSLRILRTARPQPGTGDLERRMVGRRSVLLARQARTTLRARDQRAGAANPHRSAVRAPEPHAGRSFATGGAVRTVPSQLRPHLSRRRP